MSLLPKIGVFVGFLVALAVWTWVTYVSIIYTVNAVLKERGILLASSLVGFLSLLGLFLFPWILSGFFDTRFFLFAAGGVLLATLLSSVYWAILGNPKINFGAYFIFESVVFSAKHPWFKWIDQYIQVVGLFAFPLVAGWIYFANDVPSEKVTLQIFQVVLVFLFLIGSISTLKTQAVLLMSPSIHDQARDRLLVTQLGGFIVLAMIVSMILWAFGLGQKSTGVAPAIPIHFSPGVAAGLVALMVVAHIIPYMIGLQRSKNLVRSHEKKVQEVLQDTIETLKLPRPDGEKATELSQIQSRIAQEIDAIRENVPEAWALSPQQIKDQHTALAFEKLRGDPWNGRIDDLKKLSSGLDHLRTTLNQPPAGGGKNPALENVHEVYEARLERLQKAGESNDGMKLAVGIAAVVSAIASAFVGELGKFLVDRVKSVAAENLSSLDILLEIFT